MTSSTDWVLVAVGVLVLVLIASSGYYLLQRMRTRRLQLVKDLSASPVFADDRAHNQVRMARAELEFLRRDGQDAPRAAELLDQAEAAIARRDNIRGVQLAHDAHELLVAVRRAPASARPRPTGARVASPSPVPATVSRALPVPAGALPEPEPGPVDAATAGRPPKNRMEAHFQMTLLVEQLANRPASDPGTVDRDVAERFRADAQSAYARGEYTEALRLALRGRKALGATLETLPPGRGSAPKVEPSPMSRAVPTPEDPAGSEACPRCGRPLRAGDRFCRSCGASKGPTECPRCRATIGADDTFCGRCGSPLA